MNSSRDDLPKNHLPNNNSPKSDIPNKQLKRLSSPKNNTNAQTITITQVEGDDGSQFNMVENDVKMKTPKGNEIHLSETSTCEKSNGKHKHTRRKSVDLDSKSGHLHEEITSQIEKTSDGSILFIKDTDTDVLTKSGMHYHQHQSSVLFAYKAHPLDLLKVGGKYNIDDFTGSVPDLHSKAITCLAWNPPAPVWKHESCVIEVTSEDQLLGKHLMLSAVVDAKKSNTYYGITKDYKIEVCLMKQGEGVICTQIKGISGKIGIPNIIWLASKAIGEVDNVSSYGAGSQETPLALPVKLKSNGDGTFNLKIKIDAEKLNLQGTSYLMYCILWNAGFVHESRLEGKIDLKPAFILEAKESKKLQSSIHGDKDKEKKEIKIAKAESLNELDQLEAAQRTVVDQTEKNDMQSTIEQSFSNKK